MKKIRCILTVLLTALLLSCSASLVNLTYEDGLMQNKRLRLAYYPAPTNYEPVSVGEPYAYYKKSDMTLYEIKGLDPKEWLTQAYAGSATTIFYAKDISLPTLREMEPSKIIICMSDEITYGLATVTEQELIDSLIATFENGEYEEWPLVDSIQIYELKFYSEEKYPHLYYNLIYGEFPEGKFLYDRNTKRSVQIGEALAGYIG